MKGRESSPGRRKLVRMDPGDDEVVLYDDDAARPRVDDESIYTIGKTGVLEAQACLARPEVREQCGNGLLLALFLRSIDANMWLHYIQTRVFSFADIARLCLTSTWLRRMVPLCVNWRHALKAQAGLGGNAPLSTRHLIGLMDKCTEACGSDTLQARRAHFMVLWEACRGGEYCGRCMRQFPFDAGMESRWMSQLPAQMMPVPSTWLKRHGASVCYCLQCFSDTHEPSEGHNRMARDWAHGGQATPASLIWVGTVPLTSFYYGIRMLHRMSIPKDAFDLMHITEEEAAAHAELGTPIWPRPPASVTGSDENRKCWYWLPDVVEYTRGVMAYMYQKFMGADREMATQMATWVPLNALNGARDMGSATKRLRRHAAVIWLALNSEENDGTVHEFPGMGSNFLDRVV